jgi:hypothetical protein
MELKNYYYLLQEQPGEMGEWIEIMKGRWIESAKLHCQCSPAEVIISADKITTSLISPAACLWRFEAVQEWMQKNGA